MKKIVFFSEYIYPADNSTAYFLTDIVKTGAVVFDGNGAVVTSAKLPKEMPELSVPDNFIIKRIRVCNLDKNKLIHRIFKFLYITLIFTLHSFRLVRKNDVVFSVTNPAFTVFVFAIIKKILRFKYILLAYDIFPENLLAAKLTSSKSCIYRVCKKLFDWAYAQADYVIAIGRDMQNVLKTKGVKEDRIVLIQNWANPEKICASDKNENPIIKKLAWENKKVFMFAGNIGRVQGIENLLNAIKTASEDNMAFLFVGDGQMLSKVKQFALDHPDINVHCTGAIPMAEQNTFLNACDIAIVTLEENMLGIGVPSKSYFSMASGRPILYIGENNSEIALCVKENEIGWVVEPNNCDALAKQIKLIASLPDSELKNIGKSSRNIAETKYSIKHALQKYQNLFYEVKNL